MPTRDGSILAFFARWGHISNHGDGSGGSIRTRGTDLGFEFIYCIAEYKISTGADAPVALNNYSISTIFQYFPQNDVKNLQ